MQKFKATASLEILENDLSPHKRPPRHCWDILKILGKRPMYLHKNIVAFLFSICNTTSLSRHEQVCLSTWWEKYLSKCRPMMYCPLSDYFFSCDYAVNFCALLRVQPCAGNLKNELPWCFRLHPSCLSHLILFSCWQHNGGYKNLFKQAHKSTVIKRMYLPLHLS